MEKETGSENTRDPNDYGAMGRIVDDKFIDGSECYTILEGFHHKLLMEDKTLRTFRRSFDFSQTIQRDLIPILIHIQDKKEISQIIIKILANLTTPVDCLFPTEIMTKTEIGNTIVVELLWQLFSSLDAFLEIKSTKKIIDNIRELLEKGDNMNENDDGSLNDNLLLLRNILYLPELKSSEIRTTSKNQIIWNLFTHNMDKVLIELVNTGHSGEWTWALVQVIALLYKDQNPIAFGRLLSMRIEASFLSESSDSESNTEQLSDYSDIYSNEEIVTNQTPTKKGYSRKQSKQSNLNTNENIKQKQEESKKRNSREISDHGYATQLSTQGSPSSNDDDKLNSIKPVHQKPVNMIHKSRNKDGKTLLTVKEKEDLKRKKLIKESRTKLNNMRALVHHNPTEEDLSLLLKEFTVDFLLKGYNSLLSGLFDLLETRTHEFNIAHFFWLVPHFLKCAVQLELDLECISSALSYKTVSILTYEGVELSEQIYNAQSEQETAHLTKKIHMVVNAIKEFIQTFNSYEKLPTLNERDKMHLLNLQRKISETEELRCLFVLLLRQFNPRIHSIQYLKDVIVTNHMLLMLINGGSRPNTNAILLLHMRQFVAVDIIAQYGRILETFQQNGEFLNDCVFTMMHHVAGDLESVSTLFQPKILKAFSKIWETDFALSDDQSDLVYYVIKKFINVPNPTKAAEEMKEKVSKPDLTIQETKNDKESLFWYYIRSQQSRDPVGDMIDLYGQKGVETKTRIGVIEQLLKQDIINPNKYNKLMEKEHNITVASIRSKIYSTQVNKQHEIKLLTDNLKQENKFGFVMWVQKVLLEACHAKLNRSLELKDMIEPVPYYCSMLQEPFPLVAWSCEQCSIMQSHVFLLLLHKLGLVLPSESGKTFARIPHSWSPNMMYEIACKLGPLQSDWIKFDVSLVQTETNSSKRKCLNMIEPSPKMTMSEKRTYH